MKKQNLFFQVLVFVQLIAFTAVAQNKGYDLVKNEKYNAARAFFKSEIAKNAADPKAYFDMGNFYLKINNVDSAQIYFKKGTEISATDVPCQLGLAAVFAIKGNAFEAEKIERIVNLEKTKNIDMLIFMTDAWVKSSNVPEGKIEKLIQLAKDLNKANPNIYISKANYSIKLQNYGAAASDYEMALYFDSTNVVANTKLGDIYTSIKNKELASKAYNNAYRADSNFVPMLRSLSKLFYDNGGYTRASFLFARYIQNGEPTVKDYIRYGSMLYFSKDYANSLAELQKIKEQDVVVKRLIAYNQYELKDFQNSLSSIENFFKNVNDTSIISKDYEYYGMILASNKLDSLAIPKYLKAIAMDSTKTDLYENIAKSFESQKKFPEAVNYYDKLVQTKKNPGAIEYIKLGRACYYAGANHKDTIQKKAYLIKADSLMNLASNTSKSYQVFLWRARINSQLDPMTTLGMAKPYYEKVIEICSADQVKYKKELLESYKYLGVYNIQISQNDVAKTFFQKVLDIDPTNAEVLDYMKRIK